MRREGEEGRGGEKGRKGGEERREGEEGRGGRKGGKKRVRRAHYMLQISTGLMN